MVAQLAPVGVNDVVPSGQQALAGGITSVPNPATVFVAEDISAVSLSSDFCSRTFVLLPGVNVISNLFSRWLIRYRYKDGINK